MQRVIYYFTYIAYKSNTTVPQTVYIICGVRTAPPSRSFRAGVSMGTYANYNITSQRYQIDMSFSCYSFLYLFY